AALRILHALAAQAQQLPAGGALGNGQRHTPVDGGRLDLSAQDRLVDGDRQIEDDVVALALEIGMGANLQLDQRVTRLAASHARPALALQAQHLSLDHAGWDVDVQRLALRQQDALLDAVDRLQKVDLQVIAVVHATHVEAAARTGAAEHVAENVAEI